jgi:transcriptional regulator with XRE-family HTH domain/tetratricopeptide (TPR) repeat protein
VHDEMLTSLRAGRGMSQEQLAEHSGISVRAIVEIERGATRRPHRESLRALAGALGLPAGEREAFERAGRVARPPDTRRRPPLRPALPAPVSSIIGRSGDISAVVRLIDDPSARLISVVGTGGVGKTRLALEVGWQVAARFDRVHGVDLSALRHARDVAPMLATALRTPDPATLIADDRWLLVLDSFEHVAEAATTVAALLAACPRLLVVATSRAPLRLRGEHLWPLAPLSTPDGTEVDGLAANPAVRLLVERTAAVRPGFALTDGNADAVAELCRRLDGLPLALELAAAQLRTQEPAQVLAQVGALAGDTVDLPDRHRSLRRMVEWSTRGLTEPDRRLLGLLGVFAGGAERADLEAVHAERADLEAVHAERADLEAVHGASPAVTANESGDADAALDLAARAAQAFGGGPAVRAATLTLIGNAHKTAGRYDEAAAAYAEVLDLARTTGDARRETIALNNLGALAHDRGAYAEAIGFHAAALHRKRELGDRHGVAVAQLNLGAVENDSGTFAAAADRLTEAAATFAELGEPGSEAFALALLAQSQAGRSRWDDAVATGRRALDEARRVGHAQAIGLALLALGETAAITGDPAGADRLLREALTFPLGLTDQARIRTRLSGLPG